MKKVTLACLVLFASVLLAQTSWTERKLVGSYPNWDYWWLNVRIGVDQFDTVYCTVGRYNYSQSDPEFDLYRLNGDGDTIQVTRPWHGYEYQPIIQAAGGRNVYIGQPLLGFWVGGCYHMDAGVTDDSNCVLSTNSQGNDTIYFTRLGPSGERIVWRQMVYVGNPWVGRTSLAQDPRGWLHCAFEDDIEHLVYGISTDKGLTWTWDTILSNRVLSHVRVVASRDTCIHIVFRTWTSGVQLRYLKLRPDGSVAVGASVFSDGSERWEPNVALDTAGNLRVVYVDGATSSRNLYYTVLHGRLDTGGQPAPDSELTIVPDTIIQTDPVRIAGPKVAVDSRNRAQILFEQGVYGSGGDKYVYHTREDHAQALAEVAPGPLSLLEVLPNPVRTLATVRFALPVSGPVRLKLFDASGKEVRRLVHEGSAPGGNQLTLSRQGLANGAYFLALESSSGRTVRKVILAP